MEGELTCQKCKKLFDNPINLPCSHNICYACAIQCTSETTNPQQRVTRKRDGLYLTTNEHLSDRSDCQSDDSGYLSMQEIHACLHQQLQGPILQIKCPNCNISYILDERGVDCLPKNIILEGLVEKHKAKNCDIECQLCESQPAVKATYTCEQCQVSYCDECLKVCHPKRGPLASHSLISPNGNDMPKKRQGVLKCFEHNEENISMYCALCKMPVCYLCFEEGRHCGHEAKALGTMFKEQKSEMNKILQTLSTKNQELEEFLKTLAIQASKVQENGVDFESRVVAQIDEIICQLENKKNELLATITKNVASKITDLTDQRQLCSTKVTETKGLLEYTKAVTMETDPATFLMISNSLCARLAHNVETWIGKQGLTPAATADMLLELSTKEILNALSSCKFQKATLQKKIERPKTPTILTDKCSVTNNTLALEWKTDDNDDVDNDATHDVDVDGYNIDVDDGLNGDFQTVHTTKEMMCTLGGLQFKSTYKARVQAFNSAGESRFSDLVYLTTPDLHTTKEMMCTLGGLQFKSTYRAMVQAFNSAGESRFSDLVYLTTPDLAVFNFDVGSSHKDIVFSNHQRTMTTNSFENRVALADVGFSRGVHYWEVTIDRYEGNPDPAIGVALNDCVKDAILGKDSKAWSIYVDSTRSWFQHNNAHLFRSEGGVETGSTIGLLLDLDHCLLTFYCNEEKHGPIEFPNLQEVDMVYPAFSLNRNVTMTLYTGLTQPDAE